MNGTLATATIVLSSGSSLRLYTTSFLSILNNGSKTTDGATDGAIDQPNMIYLVIGGMTCLVALTAAIVVAVILKIKLGRLRAR